MPDIDALLDLDVSARSSTVRFDLLDALHVKIGELAPDLDRPADVVNNINRTVKRDLSGMVLPPSEVAAVDVQNHRVRPTWVYPEGSELSSGVFMWSDASRDVRSFGVLMDSILSDETLILDDPISAGISLASGTTITSVLQTLADDALIPVSSIVPSTQKVADPLAWPVGTSRFTVMAALCSILGYHSPYFNNPGVLIMEPETTPTAAGADHVYAANGRIIDATIRESDDLWTPNRYVVIGSGATGTEVVGVFNAPDSAPFSAVNRSGRVVTDIYEAQGIESATQAAAMAAARYARDPGAYRWADFDSPPDPRHDTFDSVVFLGELYREQEWRLTLREGTPMRHSLRRVYT